jgi:hypothetical protein
MEFTGGFIPVDYVNTDKDEHREDEHLEDEDCIKMSTYSNSIAKIFSNRPPYPADSNWPAEGMQLVNFIGMTGKMVYTLLSQMVHMNLDMLVDDACRYWGIELVKRLDKNYSYNTSRSDWIAQNTMYGMFQRIIEISSRHLEDIFYGG